MADKKCVPIEHEALAPGYGCCQCKTYNGNHRQTCKACGHKRCDNPTTMRVAIPDKDGKGIHIVPVNTNKKDMN